MSRRYSYCVRQQKPSNTEICYSTRKSPKRCYGNSITANLKLNAENITILEGNWQTHYGTSFLLNTLGIVVLQKPQNYNQKHHSAPG